VGDVHVRTELTVDDVVDPRTGLHQIRMEDAVDRMARREHLKQIAIDDSRAWVEGDSGIEKGNGGDAKVAT
jgi:hypothetical protein